MTDALISVLLVASCLGKITDIMSYRSGFIVVEGIDDSGKTFKLSFQPEIGGLNAEGNS